MPSYISNNRERIKQRHYVTDAFTDTLFFNFSESTARDYIIKYQFEFCFIVNGSAVADDAFILPYKDFMDFFTEDLLDGAKRWVGNIRNEEIRISAGGVAHARAVQQYYNAFNLIQDAPTPLPKKLDISEFA